MVSVIQTSDDNITSSNNSLNELEPVLQKELSLFDAINIQDYDKTIDEENNISLTKQLTNIEKINTNLNTGEVELPPDGGYGWICMICVSTIQLSTWGNNSGFGVFLAYYLDNDVFPGSKPIDFAWIAGILVLNGQLFAPLSMVFVKMFGFKTTMSVACFCHFAAYLLASFATKLWQLYVCQGVLVGLSYSFMVFPALSIIPSWFLKKRSIASGFVMSGTGLGGVFYSLTINAMIKKTGNQRWALRMVAIVSTVCIVTSIFFIKRRNEPPRQTISWTNFLDNCKTMIELRVVKTTRVWYISIWFGMIMLCYNTVVFSFASFATSIGLSASQASALTAILNAGQVIGRPSVGVISDLFFGRVNYSMILNVIIFILIFAFWMNARSFGSLVVCAICFGLTMGVGNVMGQVFLADAFSLEDFIPAWCIANSIVGIFLLFVEVIALSLRDNTLENPYYYTQIFSGCVCVLCLFIISPLREWHIRKNLVEMRDLQLAQLKDYDKLKSNEGGLERGQNRQEILENIGEIDRLLERSLAGYFKRLIHLAKV